MAVRFLGLDVAAQTAEQVKVLEDATPEQLFCMDLLVTASKLIEGWVRDLKLDEWQQLRSRILRGVQQHRSWHPPVQGPMSPDLLASLAAATHTSQPALVQSMAESLQRSPTLMLMAESIADPEWQSYLRSNLSGGKLNNSCPCMYPTEMVTWLQDTCRIPVMASTYSSDCALLPPGTPFCM